MSIIEFSFKGSREDLEAILGGKLREGTGSLTTPVPVLPEAQPPSLEPLTPDPIYADGGAEGQHFALGESNPHPDTYSPGAQYVPATFNFGALPLKEGAWAAFEDLINLWLQGFDCDFDGEGNPREAQPDRLDALKLLAQSRWTIFILRWLAHYGSLQGAVYQVCKDPAEADNVPADPSVLDLAEKVSSNIVQVAHAAFPDIGGFYDNSTKWRRKLT